MEHKSYGVVYYAVTHDIAEQPSTLWKLLKLLYEKFVIPK